MKDTRIPVSVTQHGRVTVRIFDDEAYQANITQYYAGDTSTAASNHSPVNDFKKKKPSARYNWTRWRGGPMIKEQTS